jgi:REP element-mobilizing transposase RayT
MTRPDEDEFYERRNSLRLRGFDYAAWRIYFVTLVVLARRRVFFDERLANATIDCLLQLRRQIKFNLYSYCLMPDHFHALIGAGNSGKSLGEICGAFKSLTTHAYWHWFKGKLWQRQFFDHIIRNEQDFFETREYISMNPVRKGLVQKPKEWPYSGEMDEF